MTFLGVLKYAKYEVNLFAWNILASLYTFRNASLCKPPFLYCFPYIFLSPAFVEKVILLSLTCSIIPSNTPEISLFFLFLSANGFYPICIYSYLHLLVWVPFIKSLVAFVWSTFYSLSFPFSRYSASLTVFYLACSPSSISETISSNLFQLGKTFWVRF